MDVTQEIRASFKKFVLNFKRPSGTSRGVLTQKHGWILRLENELGITGLGECSVIPGLSPDYESDQQYEVKLQEVCNKVAYFLENRDELRAYPSLLFGLESAYADLLNGGKQQYVEFVKNKPAFSIPINGLIWMGTPEFMQEQIEEKLQAGFSCIKLKVGALDFDQELALLKGIRSKFSAKKITLRVDANGGFSEDEALDKLTRLSELDIHSIEQPIKAGNWTKMHQLCRETPVPIALDEELISIYELDKKKQLLDTIQPQFIILKPSLHGGFTGTLEWIQLAEERQIPWWVTSALESNIGLNAIAQFTAQFDPILPQGLGTGGLYTSNFEVPLHIEKGFLIYKLK